ncbi:MAG: family 78 glycoside hydrolase catalytic domain, partial [Clostridia bacterium]|nr:family 78 glycoside hydrolase catalytic domain [Clostridia bacterium]
MKRFISLFIALLLILPLIAGCTEDDETTTAPDGTGTDPVTTSETPAGPADLLVGGLRVNDTVTPSCVSDDPLFSWEISSSKRNIKQSSYRIKIASSEKGLDDGDLVWDSGVVSSSASFNVGCDIKLQDSTRYFWNVTIEDENGGAATSDRSYFDTALNKDGFSGAEWITQDSENSAAGVSGANWIWYCGTLSQGNIPTGTQYFRYRFSIDKDVAAAYLSYTADDYGALYFNGKKIFTTTQERGWENGVFADVAGDMIKGENVIACSAVNKEFGYAAVIVRLKLVFTDGTDKIIVSDGNWYASEKYVTGWNLPDNDEGSFKKVDTAIPYGEFPWYEKVTFPDIFGAAPYMRTEFEVSGKVRSAMLYASAAGLYESYINGEKTSTDALDPGRSEYTKRIMYQCHDVTSLLKEGKNAIGAVLGRGWYIGAYSPYGKYVPAFICKLVIRYDDGTTQTVATGRDWICTSEGPITYNDIFNGETYDARREIDGWNTAGFNDSGWEKVAVTDSGALGLGELVPQLSGTVKVMETIKAKEMTSPSDNVYIYDFGQNLAGVVSIKVKGEAGTTVTLRHAEMLNDGSAGSDGPKGTIYTANLRSAQATNRYTLKGDKNGETYSPVFTYHGFRYLEITGLSEPLPLDDVCALVLYSDMEDTGSITTSDELINKLVSNTYWGQRGNFLSTPTDCPQRDERMGWSGDAQIFSGTAAYNMNVKTFFDKYITDLNDCQRGDGSYPDVAPQTGRANYTGSGNNAWGDAGVIIPWIMYTRYGDISYIKKYYSNMKRYAGYLISTSNNYIRAQSAYGDWLSIGESTNVGVTDTAYCIRVMDILEQMARLLNKTSDAERFAGYASKYREAWNKTFVRSEGHLRSDTQTSYLVAIAFRIVPEEDLQLYADRLNEKILKNNTKLTTGFIGCPLLLPVLCEYGHTDTAFALLQQQEYPSWKYPILQGATTIWERWNSYTITNGFGDAGMNSFNHYSYGSVTEWIYSTLIGITCDETAPGFSHFILKPTCGSGITAADGEYRSVSG